MVFECDLDDLERGACRRIEIGSRAVALVRFHDDVYAIEDRCSHENVALSEGELDAGERTIECWRHGSVFDLSTGAPLSLPAVEPVSVFKVSVSGNKVTVEE